MLRMIRTTTQYSMNENAEQLRMLMTWQAYVRAVG